MSATRAEARVPSKMMRRMYARTEETVRLSDRYDSWEEQRVRFPETRDESVAVLVSSLLMDGRHAPVIDVDHPVYAVPSTTPGHFHLYIDVRMRWWRYRILLWALRVAGVIEPGYYRESKTRRGSHVRHPRVTKHDV